jgi:hypothetical protein
MERRVDTLFLDERCLQLYSATLILIITYGSCETEEENRARIDGSAVRSVPTLFELLSAFFAAKHVFNVIDGYVVICELTFFRRCFYFAVIATNEFRRHFVISFFTFFFL